MEADALDILWEILEWCFDNFFGIVVTALALFVFVIAVIHRFAPRYKRRTGPR